MGWWNRVKSGAQRLTPLQLLHAKRVGVAGQCVGLVLGMTILSFMGFWYWVPFLLFTLIVQLVELTQVSQQIKRIRDIGGG